MIKNLRTLGTRSAYPFHLKLLGVAEQVNIPIKLCIENGIFEKYGVDVKYTTVKEGTGEMLKRLDAGEADLAITVTDGFISGQAQGSNTALVGTFVDSPLTWAVCAHPNSKFNSISDIFKNGKGPRTVGISRLQSGSHTMSLYLNHMYGSKNKADDITFKVLGGFDDLKKGIHEGEAEIFLWELFTTKPSFRSGELKYIGEVSTPWPAFSIVARSSAPHPLSDTAAPFRPAPLITRDPALAHMYRHRLLPALSEGIQQFLHGQHVHESCTALYGWGSNEGGSGQSSVSRIVKEFAHTSEDAHLWMDRVRYALPNMSVDVTRTEEALSILKTAGIVSDNYPVNRLWDGHENIAVSLKNIPLCTADDASTHTIKGETDRKGAIHCGGDFSGW